MRGKTVLVNGEPVENVLVNVGEHVDEVDITGPAGTEIAYTLAFPSSYEGPLADAIVTVNGVECRTVGYADHLDPASVFGSWGLDWDMTVLVERVPGDMSQPVAIYLVEVVYDDMGDPHRSRTPLYEGMAQARMDSGVGASGEKPAPDGTVTATETWWFVVPWQEAFGSLRPNHAEIEMAGATYDVKSVEDVGMRGEFASFRAVRRG